MALIKPPITTVANGRCTSAPPEEEIAIGKKPNDATDAVIKTGLSLTSVPLIIRSRILVIPSFFNSLK